MNINLSAPINFLGYGVVGTNVLLALQQAGHNVTLWPIGPVETNPSHVQDVANAVARQDFYDTNAPSIRVWHQFDMAQHVGRFHFGMPIFELDTFTKREAHHLKTLDGLLVCSKWAADICRNNLLPKCPNTYVVPLGVNRSVFNENRSYEDKNWTTFLNVGKWEVRKGHDLLIKAFGAAFSTRDRVRLWMMCHNPFLPQNKYNEWLKLCQQSPLSGKITLVPRAKYDIDVARIMCEATCGVFPSHAEGWNLELLEMMACGKQVIATNYSAHTEFCNESNCHLINVTETEKAVDNIWFFGQGNWAKLGEPQFDQLVEYMRAVHRENQEGSLGVNKAGIETAERFSWANTADAIIKAVY